MSDPHPDLVGCYAHHGRLEFFPVRRVELDRTALSPARVIRSFGIKPGSYVLTVSLVREVVQFAPFEQALTTLGMIGINADASPYVSPFGAETALSAWQATSPVHHALSGDLSRSGIPGRAPLPPPGDCAIVQAVYVTLVAYINRLKTGRGDRLDFALLDGTSHALDPGFGISGSATGGVSLAKMPRGRAEARHFYPIIPCADGFVRICVLAARQWQGMFAWLGRPDAFADPSYNTLQGRFGSKTLIPAIARFTADKTRRELETAGQSHGVPISGLLDLDEALATEQIVARRAFVPVTIAPNVVAPFPDGVMEIDGRRAGIRGSAPALGQDQDEIRATLDRHAIASPGLGAGGRPLSGLRVLDLGVIVVGAEQGRLLADQGADVVKLEAAAFPDGSRQTRDGSLLSVTFAAGHRKQRGLGLNLRSDEGKALLRRLVETTDVILSNFKPGTLESLGLGYEALSAINPRLIMVDSSAFGPTGPWSRRLGYGPLVRASAGLTAQWRYPGEADSFSDPITVYPDHVAGRLGAIGALALLIRRFRTRRGGTVSIAQAELMLSHMATRIAARALGLPEPVHDAPWGLFRCAGDDEWCVVAVHDSAEFQASCQVIDRLDLAADPALADSAGRALARNRIDEAVGAWLAVRTPREAMETLQAAGVPAGAMLRVAELPDFPYFKERRFFRPAHHPHIAQPFLLEAAPVLSTHLPDPPDLPAPLMGEHTAEIMQDWLGLSPEEVALLATNGVAGYCSHHIGKPTIAAVNGNALGGGTESTLVSDLAIAAETASFGLPEVKSGLIAGAGGAFRLARQLPLKLAMEALLTGDPIPAQRALELGLVNAVVPQAKVMDAALALARRIAQNAPLSVQASKRVALGIADGRIEAETKSWALSHTEAGRVMRSEDAREGPRAFAEKRAPHWKGL
jgi:crotonobetainyl-CoA:carnitine CoA-transferase CaiB-like acyl-CoA transferase